jgi:NADH-quinone oxidoreductase subunit J
MSTAPLDIFFYIFASLASLLALRVVTTRNPISGAFSLVLTFFCVAAIYALMEAHFLAAIQILVYAGAVMVLFTFVIMLLNADVSSGDFGRGFLGRFMALAVLGALAVGFNMALRTGTVASTPGIFTLERIKELGGNTRALSELMFSDYILPFELTSVLLLVGIVGSVALAKRAKRHQS